VRASGLTFEVVATGLDHPVDVVAPPGDSRRLFVVEQTGRVRVVDAGHLRDRPFLDLSGEVSRGYERGLLGIAFHPRFRENGRFFIDYTDRDGDTRIERWQVGPTQEVADPDSRTLVLRVPQPYRNHNGGCLRFGPDGMLYVGMGDGGSGGDPHGNAQDPGTLLGKLLRLDVDGGDPYRVPPDRPFPSRRDARGEIWAYGLRNPWRFAFDFAESLLYIADVGQDRWEEIDVAPADTAGLDYGWNAFEGNAPYRGGTDDSRSVRPVLVYGHTDGCSVTGGVVYRGTRYPALEGHYFFSDICRGWIRSFRYLRGRIVDYRQWDAPAVEVSSFGTDAAGELYVTDLGGRLLKLVFER